MPELAITFIIALENEFDTTLRLHHGVCFHRWLPDGESDAITLPVGWPGAELRVWMRRTGYVRGFWED